MNKKLQSNREFGFLIAAASTVFSALTVFNDGKLANIIGWVIAAFFALVLALFFPRLLTPFNTAWMKLGEIMGKFVSPLVLGFIFFILITPTGVIARFLGRDELRLKKRRINSYWIERTQADRSRESFKNQF